MTDPPGDRGFPRVYTTGTPFERGRMYGGQVAAEIRRSIEGYAAVYEHARGWDWAEATRRARDYLAPIEEFHPDAVQEMSGIAAGAGLELADVLALNTRSELMFSDTADGSPGERPGCIECTSFAALPALTASGHTVVGQNWDWVGFARDSTVLVEARREDGPDFVTMVEAGLLAKTGYNSAGLGLCTNTLVSLVDTGAPGVPYHVVLRALLDAETISAATETVMTAPKAMSANYLLAHSDGLAVDLETTAGGAEAVRPLMPQRGYVAHANHFLHPDFVPSDARLANGPNTLFRLYCTDTALEAMADDPAPRSVEDFFPMLTDHRNSPSGVCNHGNPQDHPLDRYVTVASAVYDLTAMTMYVAAGNPCSTPHVRVAEQARLQSPTRPRVAS